MIVGGKNERVWSLRINLLFRSFSLFSLSCKWMLSFLCVGNVIFCFIKVSCDLRNKEFGLKKIGKNKKGTRERKIFVLWLIEFRRGVSKTGYTGHVCILFFLYIFPQELCGQISNTMSGLIVLDTKQNQQLWRAKMIVNLAN